MWQARSIGLAALACVCLVSSDARAQLRDERIVTVRAADGTALEVTQGFVRVPERRAGGEASATIDLAVVRIRRPGAEGGPAHVILAGGPGDSGVGLVTGLARQGGAVIADLMGGDLIGIDQRGTGRSMPNLDTPARYELPLDEPGSPAAWLPRMEAAARRVAAGFRARGIQLEAYNSRESADDVNAVRQALGYERITLWGRSYGSHLALATAARHPAMVERLVLVSPEGPNHTWKLPSQVDAVIERLAARGAPDLPANMRKALARLAERPAVVSVTQPGTGRVVPVSVGAFDVQWITVQALGDPRLLATLPEAYREMAAGDFTRIAQVSLMRRAQFGVESAMKHMMDLSSGVTRERRARIDREARTSLMGNAINFPGMYLGDAWGARDLGDEFRAPVKSDAPTLILAGDLDPRTPVSNAREIASTLPNAHVVVLENATHQFDLFGPPRIRDVLSRFLRDQPVPTRLVLPSPFGRAPAGAGGR